MKVCKEIVLLSLGAILAVLQQVTVSLGLVRWVRTNGKLVLCSNSGRVPADTMPRRSWLCFLPTTFGEHYLGRGRNGIDFPFRAILLAIDTLLYQNLDKWPHLVVKHPIVLQALADLPLEIWKLQTGTKKLNVIFGNCFAKVAAPSIFQPLQNFYTVRRNTYVAILDYHLHGQSNKRRPY